MACFAQQTRARYTESSLCKIMMPGKPCCEHMEGLESGLRSWEHDVGEWGRDSGTPLADAVKYRVMMNMAPIFLKKILHVGAYADSAVLGNALLQWYHLSRNLGASSTSSAWNRTGADDDNRMQVDFLKKGKETGKGKHPNQKGTRTGNTDVNICKNFCRTGHWVKDCWRPHRKRTQRQTQRHI